jgi:xylose dehydrogenase (NAD/NADP)
MSLQNTIESFERRDWAAVEDVGDVEPVRYALIGAGWWTREQAIPAMRDAQLCEPTVIVSGSKEKATDLAEEHEQLQGISYREYHNAAATDAYDAVYVATPNGAHLEYVSTAAELEKHVLCEKPMEMSVDRARRLVAACDRNDVLLMVAYRMQTEPTVRRARELIRQGAIGEVVFCQGSMTATLLDIIPDTNQWRLDPELSGGCALIDLGIYPLNTARFLLDEDPVRVAGWTDSEHAAFADVDEHVTFHLEFPSAMVSCEASHNAYESSYVRIVGTEGELTLDSIFHPWDRRQLTLQRASGATTVTLSGVNQMLEVFDYFADCVRTGRPPFPDGEHGVTDMEAIQAVYDSAGEDGTPRRL